jgi:hypothetical protein
MSAKAISYLHLALTYERKLDKYDLGEKERSLEIRSALACCAHASVLDINKEFSSQINELQKRLGEEKPEESKKEKDEKESTLYTLKCELDGTAKGTLALKNPSDDKKKKD